MARASAQRQPATAQERSAARRNLSRIVAGAALRSSFRRRSSGGGASIRSAACSRTSLSAGAAARRIPSFPGSRGRPGGAARRLAPRPPSRWRRWTGGCRFPDRRARAARSNSRAPARMRHCDGIGDSASAATSSAGPARNSTSAGRRICTRPPPSRRVPPAQRVRAVRATDAKGHQRAAVIQVDADPVPAHRLGVEVFARPFMIQPRLAGHCVLARRADERAATRADAARCSSSWRPAPPAPCG